MSRRPVPAIAWLLSGGTALALVILTIPTLRTHGTAWFFREGDGYLYRAVAFDPFGKGSSFAAVGRVSEIPYRYGRVGLPLLAWFLSFGQAGPVPWMLITIHLASIAAVPGLAAVLLDEYGAAPLGGAVALLAPGLLLIREYVFAEPLLIAVVLLGFILEAKGRPRAAVAVFAYAVLVKEIAVLALVPWVWRALKRRDLRNAAFYLSAVVPYALWCVWLKIRVGEFPFLAHTDSRIQALSWPGGGIREAIHLNTPDHTVVMWLMLVTAALCVAGAYVARRFPIGQFSAALALLTLCLGVNALRYEAETIRLLTVPQVFGMLCLVAAFTANAPTPRTKRGVGHELPGEGVQS